MLVRNSVESGNEIGYSPKGLVAAMGNKALINILSPSHPVNSKRD